MCLSVCEKERQRQTEGKRRVSDRVRNRTLTVCTHVSVNKVSIFVYL